jgi:4-aminobutyrate aminotransferase
MKSPMHTANSSLDPLRSEGDLNLSPRRASCIEENLDLETRRWLEEDARYFLHQSLSTPCLDVLKSCHGATITNLQGRELLDFHGNNVHQVGFSHPRVLGAIKAQLEDLSFCPRRYTNIPAIRLAKSYPIRPRRFESRAVCT